MPTLNDLMGILRSQPQGQPQGVPTLSDILSKLLGIGSAQAADGQWRTTGDGLQTKVMSGAQGVQAPAAPNPNVGFSRDQNAEGLVRALMARGIPEPQARQMAMQKLQGR